MTMKKTQYAKPVYAVAAVGDLAVEQIKKLPETATRLRTRVESEFGGLQDKVKQVDLAEVRGKVRTELDDLTGRVKTEVTQLREKVQGARAKRVENIDKLRANAQDTATGLMDTAQKQFKVVTKQAAEVYQGLVTRGAKVLGKPADKAVGAPAPAAPKATKPVKTTKKAAK
ncbi:MAG: hypothetical protein GEU94_05215 [Micromonosporaceae bacterium]|nr:hypothetical protein [Micromonosporaceae bacterium]